MADGHIEQDGDQCDDEMHVGVRHCSSHDQNAIKKCDFRAWIIVVTASAHGCVSMVSCTV